MDLTVTKIKDVAVLQPAYLLLSQKLVPWQCHRYWQSVQQCHRWGPGSATDLGPGSPTETVDLTLSQRIGACMAVSQAGNLTVSQRLGT